MIKVGNVFALYYSLSRGHTSIPFFDVDRKGILNDKHYNKNIDRSILIASLESYALVKKHNIDLLYGGLGENILIDYKPYHLAAGTRLKIGEVTLEISQPCTLCKSLTKIDPMLPKLLRYDRGIFAKVIESGTIAENDDIYLLN